MKIDYLNKTITDLSPVQILFCRLAEEKKCPWCKGRFPEMMKKNPGRFIPDNAYAWFTADFLVHVYTTHGFMPDDITNMLNELRTSPSPSGPAENP